MEIKIKHPSNNTIIDFETKRGAVSITYVSSVSNCKLGIIENASNLFINNYFNDSERKEAVDLIIKNMNNRNILFTLTSQPSWQWLVDNYEHYYATKVSCGYNNGYQYHILVKGHSDVRKPIKYIEEDTLKMEQKAFPKDKVLEIIKESFSKTINRDKRLQIISEELDLLK